MEMAYGMWHFTHEMDNMFALSDRLTERQTDRLRDIHSFARQKALRTLIIE